MPFLVLSAHAIKKKDTTQFVQLMRQMLSTRKCKIPRLTRLLESSLHYHFDDLHFPCSLFRAALLLMDLKEAARFLPSSI